MLTHSFPTPPRAVGKPSLPVVAHLEEFNTEALDEVTPADIAASTKVRVNNEI